MKRCKSTPRESARLQRIRGVSIPPELAREFHGDVRLVGGDEPTGVWVGYEQWDRIREKPTVLNAVLAKFDLVLVPKQRRKP
jgi:hypothetical protein